MTTPRTDESNGARIIDTTRNVVLLFCRIGLGILMFWHAKVIYDLAGGFAGVGDGYAQSGLPAADLLGPANVLFEWVGGVAMVLGLAVPLVGVGMAINMVGAWVFVHNTALYSVDGGGPEGVIAIGLLSLLIAVLGSGRYGVDHLLFGRKRANRTAADVTA